MNVNEETRLPDWLTFATIEDFNDAMTAIETWDKSREKEVRKVGDALDPDISKPYTIYDADNLRIWADNDVMNLLT